MAVPSLIQLSTQRGLEDAILEMYAQVRELKAQVDRTERTKKVKTVVPTLSIALSGYVELASPITINDAGGTTVSWTTFDLTPYIPNQKIENGIVIPGAAFVVLDVRGTSGAASELRFQVRRASGNTEYELAACYGAGAICSGTSCPLPIVKSAGGYSLDYQITAGALSTWTLRLVGYYKYNYVQGTEWTQFTNPDGTGGGTGTGGAGGGGVIPPL